MKDHDERLWRREGHEEGWRSRCAYLWWEWRLIWLMQMNVAGVYRWISNETTPPPGQIWPSPEWHHQGHLDRTEHTPWKTSFFDPACCPTYQTEKAHTHTHIFSFQGDELFQWHSFREAQLTLRMIHQHRPRVKSNARRHHVRRGGCRGGGDLHRNNHIFQSERPLDQNYTEDWSCQSKTHVKS